MSREKSKWYDFHQNHGHTTDKCFAMKDEIKKMLKGKLRKYVDRNGAKKDLMKKTSGGKGEKSGRQAQANEKDDEESNSEEDDPDLPLKIPEPKRRMHIISFDVKMISRGLAGR